MKKESKKVACNLSLKTILSCIIVTTIVITNSVTTKATEINNTANTLGATTVNANDEQKFIIDSPTKYYDNIKELEKISNFKFKVPDYLIEDYKVKNLRFVRLSTKDNFIEIFYEKGDKSFSFIVSEQDPLESSRRIENEQNWNVENAKVENQKHPMKLGKISGLNVIFSTALPYSQIKEGQKFSKYYAWKDKELYYSIQYNLVYKNNNISKESVNISQNTIEKIAKSIKYPEEK